MPRAADLSLDRGLSEAEARILADELRDHDVAGRLARLPTLT